MNTQTNLAPQPQTNRSLLRTALNRRIRWGTTNDSSQKRAMILSVFALGPILVWMLLGLVVRNCYLSHAVPTKISNNTSPEGSLQCLIFNKECNCRISSNETVYLDLCLPRLEFCVLRIVPLVSFVLQLFAFREFITVGTDNNRCPTQVSWVMFALVSIGMYSTHCYHNLLGMSILVTSGLLVLLSFYDYTGNTAVTENERANTNPLPSPLQPTDNS
jgi:hypothetical protein